MCELSLDETGLTGKKGAEILENDFEQEWAKHGGREYLKSNKNRIHSKYVQQFIQNYHWTTNELFFWTIYTLFYSSNVQF